MKKKKLINLAILFVILTIVALLVYNYVFNRKHRDIANEEAAISLSVDEFYSYFEKDEALATTNYLDKVIEIEGGITSIENDNIVLNERALVFFDSKEISKFKKGDVLIIKGRCIGYDELLEMVKIDQATLINTSK